MIMRLYDPDDMERHVMLMVEVCHQRIGSAGRPGPDEDGNIEVRGGCRWMGVAGCVRAVGGWGVRVEESGKWREICEMGADT